MQNKLLLTVIMLSKFIFYGVVCQVFVVTMMLGYGSEAQKYQSVKEKRISLELKNVSLKKALSGLEKTSGYSFTYDDKSLNSQIKLDLIGQDKLVYDYLLELSKRGDLYFKQYNNSISVFRQGSNKEPNLIQVIEQVVDVDISGKVLDENGQGLPGAAVVQKGTTNGTTTDLEGNYKLNLPEDATISISFIGYATQEIVVGAKSTIDVQMAVDINQLEDIVVVGYGVQKKSDLTGAIATVEGADLAKTKTAGLTNSIAGRLPGVIAKQTSGEPGNDESSISIRGFGTPLVIVDGIQRDFNDIAAEEVESMTVLKDASAAIYGARAGNGVILITTKRGTIGAPQVTLSSTTTLVGYTNFLKYSNSGQYSELMNEFKTNDGLAPLFTDEEVAKYASGEDPINYPNTDWWNLTMNNYAPQTQHEVSLRGGSESIKYYTLFSFLDQQGGYKSGDNKYKRYNVRANIDGQVTKRLSVSVDLSMIAEDLKSPLRTVDNLWADINNALPTYLGEFSDKTKIAYGGQVPISPVAGSTFDLGGYQADNNRHINIKGSFNYDIPGIEGLSVDGFGSFFEFGNDYKNWEKNYFVYEYDGASDTYLNKGSSFKTKLDQGYQVNSSFTTNLALKYVKTFNEKHNIDALVLYERIQRSGHNVSAHGENYLTDAIDYLFAAGGEGTRVGGSASEDGRESYVGRFNYNYDSKYLFQATVRYDGSPRFNSSNQWGFFPSFSAGWRLSEESFIKNNVEWIDNLKLRASHSNLAYDATGNFQYLSGYEITTGQIRRYMDSGYVLDGSPYTTIHSTGLANPNITWENMTIQNIGLDFGINGGAWYGEFDWFYRSRTDMLGTRIVSLPNTFGANLPTENLNSQSNRGFELLLGHRNHTKAFKYDINANIAWTRAKWEDYDEPLYEDEDDVRMRKRSGNWVDRVFGYKSDGLFTSQSEIDNLSFDQDQKENVTLAPGDIKYVDTNKDGTLDWRDQVLISTSNLPQLTFGLNMTMEYKGFDLSLLLQGAGNYDVAISTRLLPFGTTNTFALTYENRWNEDNNSKDALLPRVSATGRVNNTKPSDFWLVDGTYMRVKNLNLGYTIPMQEVVGIYSIRLFFSATNLLTFSGTNKWDMDPEAANNSGRYYPQPKTFSLGVKFKI